MSMEETIETPTLLCIENQFKFGIDLFKLQMFCAVNGLRLSITCLFSTFWLILNNKTYFLESI